jgi:acyl-CoA synthetase (AMP-forming)/AMP-acid ligase II
MEIDIASTDSSTMHSRARWQPEIAPERASSYLAAGAWPGRTVAQFAWERAEQTPDAIAFHFADGGSATYAQIAEEALALAGGLKRLGLLAGDTVSLQLPNWREAAVINLAAAALGLVINPITPIYRSAELRAILGDAHSRLIFIPQRFRSIDYAQMLAALRPELPEMQDIVVVRPVDEAHGSRSYAALLGAGRESPPRLAAVDPNSAKLLMFTSGTTGRAKGVLHTHNTIQYAPALSMREWGLGAGDVMLMPSPVTHVTGYIFGLELPFMSGVEVALMEHWNATAAVAYIDRVHASACVGATPFLKELVDEAERQGNRLQSMRIFVCGGAAVPPQLIERVPRATAQCRAFRVFGATEVPLVTQGFPDPKDLSFAAHTDGRVVGYEVRIVAPENGALVPVGQTGEILARGPAMMAGYIDPSDNAKAFDADGYFRTGDIGHLTSDGALVISSRLKDLIIRGGENLSPKEIEDALMRHPAIREAAVVATPHPRLGEGVCACLLLRHGAAAPELAELAAFLDAQGLARQKFPERLLVLDDLPRTPSGKVRKDMLRETVRKSDDGRAAG